MGYDGFQSMSQAPPVAAVASTATRRSQMLSALPQMDQVGEHYSVTHAHTRSTNYISCMEFMRANPLSKSHEFAKGSDFVLWSTLALGNVLSLACKAFVWFWIDSRLQFAALCSRLHRFCSVLQIGILRWSLSSFWSAGQNVSSQASCKRLANALEIQKIAFCRRQKWSVSEPLVSLINFFDCLILFIFLQFSFRAFCALMWTDVLVY